MKLADKRSSVIKDLEDVEYMSALDFPHSEEFIRDVVKDAIGFIKMQDNHIRTIRAQRDKARNELRRLKEGEHDTTTSL